MANYNKVILAGNLTRDPQVSYLPSNTPVAEFGLAINRRWRGQDGQNKEETCFVDCRAYGRSAETLSQYCSKGKPLLVEGRLQFQQWTAQDGSKRSKHIVVVEQFQFMDSRRSDSGEAPPARPAPQRGTVRNQARDPDQGPPPMDHEAEVAVDSDIPF